MPPAYAEQSGNAILTGDNIDEVLKLKKIEKNGAPAQPRVDDPSTIPGRSDADFAVNDMVIDAKNGEETFGARGKIVADTSAKRNWITVRWIMMVPNRHAAHTDSTAFMGMKHHQGSSSGRVQPLASPRPPWLRRPRSGAAQQCVCSGQEASGEKSKKHKETGGEAQGTRPCRRAS